MKTIQEILELAIEHEASDVFITVGVPITIKVNGVLEHIDDEVLKPLDTEFYVKNLLKDEKHFDEYMREGEKDFAFSLPRVGRFRVAAYIQRGSMAAALRVLRFELPDTVALGIPQVVLDFHKRTKGLILVTGPTGSGKSTTLSAIINLINSERSCHILTLEDPIEYLHKHKKSIVEQREMGIDSKSYAKALKSALRQAPDVIFIGEMRDYETISIALTAAETGHLVLSTLHTIGASKTMDRIIDVFPPNQQQQVRVQLSTVLQAVVSQQLIPSQISGLAAAFEIMVVNNPIRNLIRESKIAQIDSAIQTGKSFGMISMDMSLAKLCSSGIITREDALLQCINQEVLLKYIT